MKGDCIKGKRTVTYTLKNGVACTHGENPNFVLDNSTTPPTLVPANVTETCTEVVAAFSYTTVIIIVAVAVVLVAAAAVLIFCLMHRNRKLQYKLRQEDFVPEGAGLHLTVEDEISAESPADNAPAASNDATVDPSADYGDIQQDGFSEDSY